ncbi:hypothetical protein BDN72DRAFT_236333 [Pluteus cervinus]|uniref:Uncharacterized protein n=1 Tax=Pluteus cervinus TaxID=181527 RepID=A0ACD3BHE9_9AGAR|nr:hypothetical protein BDN72DRAFT_236333 [Pluteus cervinus]
MCHRELFLNKSVDCGHLTFTSEKTIDCEEEQCFLSTSHPKDCTSGGEPCRCRRYYEQPDRQITEVPGKCSRCPP